MALNADQRQQIVLELEARGADAASLLAHALEEVEVAFRKNIKAYEDKDQTATKTIQTFERWIGVQTKLLAIQEAGAQANEALAESAQKVDVGWAKLVVTAIKYKDSLEAVAAKTKELADASSASAEAMQKIDVGLYKLIDNSLKFADSLRQSVISIGQLKDAAADLKSDRIVEMHDNTKKLAAVFEESVLDVGRLQESVQKLRSDKIDQFYESTRKLEAEFESTVLDVGALNDSAQRLKSDRIDEMHTNTRKLTAAFESTVITTDQLAASVLKMRSDNIDRAATAAEKLRESFARAGKSATDADAAIRSMSPTQIIKLADETDRAAQRTTRMAYAFSAFAYASQDFAQSGFAATINNIPLMTQYAIQASPALEKLANAVGGATVVAGGFMIAGLALDQLFKNETVQAGIKGWARSFDLIRDPARDAAQSVEGMTEQIDQLRTRKIDFTQEGDAIRKLTREVDFAKQAMQELDALNRQRTQGGEASHKMVTDAIADSGGGRGKFQEAMVEIAKRTGTYGAGTEEGAQINRYRAERDEAYKVYMAKGAGSPEGREAGITMGNASRMIDMLTEKIRPIADQKIADTISLKHGEASRQTLEDIANAPENQDVFAKYGIDTWRLAGGIGGAADPFKEDRRKMDLERARKEKAAREKIDRDAAENVKHEQKMKEDAAREAKKVQDSKEAEGVWQIQQDERIKREKAQAEAKTEAERRRAERAEPGLAAKRDASNYGQEFQHRAWANMGVPINGGQAEKAGKQVAALVKGGADVDTAMERTFADLVSGLARANATQVRQMAQWEQLQGYVGMWTVQQRQMEAQMRRNRGLRPTNNVHP